MDDEFDYHKALTAAHAENTWLKNRSAELESALVKIKNQFDKCEIIWQDKFNQIEFNARQVEKKYEEKFQESLASIKRLNDDYKQLQIITTDKDREIRRLHEEISALSEIMELDGNVSPQNATLPGSSSSWDTKLLGENAFRVCFNNLKSSNHALVDFSLRFENLRLRLSFVALL
jgi:predicted  nucleic acid-binding Zn-ribbon protein